MISYVVSNILKKCLFSSFQTNSKTSKWFIFQIKILKNEFLFSWKIKIQKYNSLKFMYLSILLNPKIRNQVKIKGFSFKYMRQLEYKKWNWKKYDDHY